MTGYDLFAAVIILASVGAGWVRGGARELVTLVSFGLAAILSLLALPVTGPLARSLVATGWIGSILAAVVVFLVIYFGLRMLGASLSRRLRDTPGLSGLDRLLGFVVGGLRALVLLGAIHLVFHAATPPESTPAWFREARVFPVSHAAARAIQAVLPAIGRGADALAPAVGSSVRDGFSSDDTAPPQSGTSAPAEAP